MVAAIFPRFSCSKMCSLSAGFCNSPRVGFQWQPDKKEWVGNQADVLVCFDYWTCVQMGARHQKPLLIYDGMQYGALENTLIGEVIR